MIKPPKWAPDAIPTKKGWQRGREVLVSKRFKPREIQEYMEANYPEMVKKKKVEEQVEPKDAPQTLTESPTTEGDFVAEHMEHGLTEDIGTHNPKTIREREEDSE